jgi:hypothetical protein
LHEHTVIRSLIRNRLIETQKKRVCHSDFLAVINLGRSGLEPDDALREMNLTNLHAEQFSDSHSFGKLGSIINGYGAAARLVGDVAQPIYLVGAARKCGRSEKPIPKYSSSGFAFFENSPGAAHSMAILSLMFLLTSKSIAIEIEASSAMKYRISCGLSSS